MEVRPTFRRFGLLVLAGVLTSACTSSAPVADTEPTPTAPPATAAEPPASTFPSIAPTVPSLTAELEPLTTDELAAAELPGLVVSLSDDREVVVLDPAQDFRPTLLSTTGAAHSQPTWSSDGSRIAWTSFGPEGPQLTISTPDGEDQMVRATTTPAFYYAWGPDDSWLAALGPHPGGVELFIAEVDSEETRRIATGQPFFVDWSSEGDLVAAVNGRSFADIPASGGDAPTQRDIAPLGQFQAPAAIDPKRTVVAFETFDGNDVVVIEDGEEPVLLASAAGPVAFSVNPQDSRLAVLTFAADDEFEVIAQTEEPQLAPNSVSVLDVDAPGTIVELDIPEPLAMRWSPDGKTLAVLTVDEQQLRWMFVGDEAILPGPAFIPTTEFANSYLPFADQYDRSSTWWSPDSAAFIFAGTVGTDAGIWVDLVGDDRGAVQVSEGRIAFWSPGQ